MLILGGSPDQYLPTASLKESEFDSLSTMEMVNYIDEQCGSKELKPPYINDQFTVQSIVDVINASLVVAVMRILMMLKSVMQKTIQMMRQI